MLGATLLLELARSQQSSVEFQSDALSTTLQVPTLAMVFSALSLALGWAFVLTGASDCARRVFLPVAAIFLIQWILFAPAEGVLAPLIGLGGILLIGTVAWAHFFSHGSTRWRNLPLLEFVAWLALMLVAIAGLLFGEGRQQAAIDLETALSFPQVLTAPFWILLGLEAVDTAVKLAREIVLRLRRWISARWFGTLVILVLLIKPIISFALILNDGGWWGIDLVVSLLLAGWALVLRLSGRLTVHAASILLALSLVLPVLTLGWSQPFRKTDLTTVVLSGAGIVANVLPAALLFVGLATYDVLNFGADFANTNGRIMPRGGRVLMYFGTVLLVGSFILFFLNARVIATGQPDDSLDLLIDIPFVVGILFLGLPYLAWIVLRRRRRLVSEDLPSSTT
jgi:hypothetical protein